MERVSDAAGAFAVDHFDAIGAAQQRMVDLRDDSFESVFDAKAVEIHAARRHRVFGRRGRPVPLRASRRLFLRPFRRGRQVFLSTPHGEAFHLHKVAAIAFSLDDDAPFVPEAANRNVGARQKRHDVIIVPLYFLLVALAASVTLVGCGSSPSTPSAPDVAPSPAPQPAPGPIIQAFSVDLPIASGDSGTSAYGIWPFGVHGSSHALDGHPGFDVEFRPGASVRAAADGTVQNVVSDSNTSGRYTIRIDHAVGQQHYATDYTNLSNLAPGVAAGAAIARGSPLGAAGVQTQFIGSSQVTWAMTHFQVNDFSRTEGLTNPNAVSPEAFLSASGRSVFETIWRASAYQTEWCEPFATNSRVAGFPMSRTWTLQSGPLPARIDVRCVSESSLDYEYTFRAADGSPLEAGTIRISASVKPLPTIDTLPASGAGRLGVYDIVGDAMRLNLGAPGAARPASLDGAAVYSTR